MIIYKITNLLNKKIYVGQTKQLVEKRFLQHSKVGSPLGQAMRECGLENFTIEVLKSKFPNGYDLSNGGAGFVKQKNYSHGSVIMMFAMKLKRLPFEKGITQAEFAKIIRVA